MVACDNNLFKLTILHMFEQIFAEIYFVRGDHIDKKYVFFMGSFRYSLAENQGPHQWLTFSLTFILC